MTIIGSGLRAPPSTLGSRSKSKTPDSTLPISKGKENVDSLKKRKVAFDDAPQNSPPPALASEPDPLGKQPGFSFSGAPSGQDKDLDLLELLRQLPEKAGLNAAFINHFTSTEGWEKMKRRPPKVAFHAAMRMPANTVAATILMYDPVLECIVKCEKVEEIAQTCEDLKKTREDEKNSFESEKQQLYEALAKEKLEKEQLAEKIKELEKTISQHPGALKEESCKAVEEFKATESKELEDKANDIATSTIIYNIYCECPAFDFSFLGKDVVELVESWKADEAAEETAAGKGAPIE